MRLDKFLCEMNIGSRSQVKSLIKKKLIKVNGAVITSADMKINELTDCITFDGQTLTYQKNSYYILNKPSGYVTSTSDPKDITVMTLLKGIPCRDLFPVGRLDKDTEGLLLFTDDGALAHCLLAPGKHVPKIYYMHLASPISQEQILQLTSGVDIGEKRPCQPAEVKVLSETEIELTIHEGKFHQVKRMLKVVGNEVLYLKRIAFGPLKLDEEALPAGTHRKLSEDEVNLLKQCLNQE